MNIADPVLFHSRSQAPHAAMCAPGPGIGLISYGRLGQFIRSIASNAHAQGLVRGDVVALFIEDRILHAAFILGLSRIGITTLSPRATELPAALNVAAAISDKPQPFKNVRRTILLDARWTAGDAPGSGRFDESQSGADTCRIILTSGTTGEPKAVAFSHDMLVARTARHNWAFGSRLPGCSRVFVDPGLGTAIGFLSWLYTLTRGGTVFFRGDDAIETMQAFNLYDVQCMIGSPAALAEFVECYEQAPEFAPRFEVVLSVGGLLLKSLSERVRARICSNVVACYGSTEANIVATAPANAIASTPGAVGYLTPGVIVQIVDRSGHRIPPGAEGIVRISGEFTVGGYLGDTEESRSAFRDGWFYPGDIGSLTEDQLLIVTGRENSVLNVGGDKVSPERVERVLLAFPGVVQAGAFSVLNSSGVEELIAVVVASTFREDALRAHCEHHLPPEFVPRRFLTVNAIPLNEMGKIDRRRLAQFSGPI
jgi:acyl-coenzyme A synthetase/AMP-(fatty) acid ligase